MAHMGLYWKISELLRACSLKLAGSFVQLSSDSLMYVNVSVYICNFIMWIHYITQRGDSTMHFGDSSDINYCQCTLNIEFIRVNHESFTIVYATTVANYVIVTISLKPLKIEWWKQFPANDCRFSKEHWFFEGSQASTVFPCEISNMSMNEYRAMVEWYWQGENPQYSERNLYHGHSVHHKSHKEWSEITPGPPRYEDRD